MDDDVKKLLEEIRANQREQLELLHKIHSSMPPWLNWRFSLLQLLAGMTIFAVIVVLLILSNE